VADRPLIVLHDYSDADLKQRRLSLAVALERAGLEDRYDLAATTGHVELLAIVRGAAKRRQRVVALVDLVRDDKDREMCGTLLIAALADDPLCAAWCRIVAYSAHVTDELLSSLPSFGAHGCLTLDYSDKAGMTVAEAVDKLAHEQLDTWPRARPFYNWTYNGIELPSAGTDPEAFVKAVRWQLGMTAPLRKVSGGKAQADVLRIVLEEIARGEARPQPIAARLVALGFAGMDGPYVSGAFVSRLTADDSPPYVRQHRDAGATSQAVAQAFLRDFGGSPIPAVRPPREPVALLNRWRDWAGEERRRVGLGNTRAAMLDAVASARPMSLGALSDIIDAIAARTGVDRERVDAELRLCLRMVESALDPASEQKMGRTKISIVVQLPEGRNSESITLSVRNDPAFGTRSMLVSGSYDLMLDRAFALDLRMDGPGLVPFHGIYWIDSEAAVTVRPRLLPAAS
jgi:hypothetical protein